MTEFFQSHDGHNGYPGISCLLKKKNEIWKKKCKSEGKNKPIGRQHADQLYPVLLEGSTVATAIISDIAD